MTAIKPVLTRVGMFEKVTARGTMELWGLMKIFYILSREIVALFKLVKTNQTLIKIGALYYMLIKSQ